ncbi:uncharacterized protein VTP21DRAFT_6812 [Calcarisporiella thermophila]|uniref:uncharacterized protein n=1 Tax=Calcarisporiella thermophila TaxID=911321 RepID=UPI0037445A8B
MATRADYSLNAPPALRRGSSGCGMKDAGWLLKLSRHSFKIWHRRWFVLDGYELKYYKNKYDIRPTGTIDLTRYCTVTAAPSSRSPSPTCSLQNSHVKSSDTLHTFQLHPKNSDERTYVFKARTEAERDGWVACLRPRLERNIVDVVLDRLNLSSASLVGGWGSDSTGWRRGSSAGSETSLSATSLSSVPERARDDAGENMVADKHGDHERRTRVAIEKPIMPVESPQYRSLSKDGASFGTSSLSERRNIHLTLSPQQQRPPPEIGPLGEMEGELEDRERQSVTTPRVFVQASTPTEETTPTYTHSRAGRTRKLSLASIFGKNSH